MDASKLAAKSATQSLVSARKVEAATQLRADSKPKEAAKPQATQEASKPKPQPTTNSQGQRIGTRLNVTA
jgi:uncharacterized membrane protein